jgi:hypothetical protein
MPEFYANGMGNGTAKESQPFRWWRDVDWLIIILDHQEGGGGADREVPRRVVSTTTAA